MVRAWLYRRMIIKTIVFGGGGGGNDEDADGSDGANDQKEWSKQTMITRWPFRLRISAKHISLITLLHSTNRHFSFAFFFPIPEEGGFLFSLEILKTLFLKKHPSWGDNKIMGLVWKKNSKNKLPAEIEGDVWHCPNEENQFSNTLPPSVSVKTNNEKGLFKIPKPILA